MEKNQVFVGFYYLKREQGFYYLKREQGQGFYYLKGEQGSDCATGFYY
jgi:hypothetical protein